MEDYKPNTAQYCAKCGLEFVQTWNMGNEELDAASSRYHDWLEEKNIYYQDPYASSKWSQFPVENTQGHWVHEVCLD